MKFCKEFFKKERGLLFPEDWCVFLSKGIVFFFRIGFQFFEGMIFFFSNKFFFFVFSVRRNFFIIVFSSKSSIFSSFLKKKTNGFILKGFFRQNVYVFKNFSVFFPEVSAFFQMFFVSKFFQIVLKQRVPKFFFWGKTFFFQKNFLQFFCLKETFIVTKNKLLFSLSEVFFFSRFFFFKSKVFLIFFLLGGFSFNKQVFLKKEFSFTRVSFFQRGHCSNIFFKGFLFFAEGLVFFF